MKAWTQFKFHILTDFSRSLRIDTEDLSDVTSVSSIDTWTTTGSMISGLEPHQQQNLANGLTIRRVSRAANGEVVYPCDFCDRYFTNRHHLSSHMV